MTQRYVLFSTTQVLAQYVARPNATIGSGLFLADLRDSRIWKSVGDGWVDNAGNTEVSGVYAIFDGFELESVAGVEPSAVGVHPRKRLLNGVAMEVQSSNGAAWVSQTESSARETWVTRSDTDQLDYEPIVNVGTDGHTYTPPTHAEGRVFYLHVPASATITVTGITDSDLTAPAAPTNVCYQSVSAAWVKRA